MYSLFMKINYLPHPFTVNLPLVEFIHILTDFFHLSISLVPFTKSFTGASEYPEDGLSYTLS